MATTRGEGSDDGGSTGEPWSRNARRDRPGISSHRARAAREAAGLYQREVATRLGVTDASVGHWETGRSVPGTDALLRQYAMVLGVEVDELYEPGTVFDRDDDPGEPTPEIVVRQGFSPVLVPGTAGGRRVVRVGGDTIGNSGP